MLNNEVLFSNYKITFDNLMMISKTGRLQLNIYTHAEDVLTGRTLPIMHEAPSSIPSTKAKIEKY
jgi:hypothetical protein